MVIAGDRDFAQRNTLLLSRLAAGQGHRLQQSLSLLLPVDGPRGFSAEVS